MHIAKLETWRRITRLELQHLCSELSAAAMATIDLWPQTGEGRAIKAACERAVQALEHVNARDIRDGFEGLGEIVNDLRAAMTSSFFTEHLAQRKLRSGKWKGSELGVVAERVLSGVSTHIAKNVRYLPHRTVAVAPAAPRVAEPATRDDLLSRITPSQQIGPVQFEVRNGKLRVRSQTSLVGERNPSGAEHARRQLVADASWLIDNLHQSNVDRRAVAILEDMHDHLSRSQNIVRVGITNLACEQVVSVIEEMAATLVIARMKAFSVGVALYISQFDEWHRFVDSAADHDLRIGDARRAYKVGRKLVGELKAKETLADPEVPRSIELLLKAVATPDRASKRAVFALIRTIENFIAKVFSEFGGVLGATSEGLRTGVKKGVTVAAAVAALGIAATAATEIAPTAQHVLKSDWLKKAAEIVREGLKEAK